MVESFEALTSTMVKATTPPKRKGKPSKVAKAAQPARTSGKRKGKPTKVPARGSASEPYYRRPHAHILHFPAVFSPAEIEKITAHFDAARDQLEPALMHDDGSGGRIFGTSRSTNMIAVSACFALVSPRSRHFRMLRRLSSRFRIGRLCAVPDYTNTQAP